MSTYLYAITSADHPVDLDGLDGVGRTPQPLRTLTTTALAAVVSDAPDGLRGKRRDLAAHQAVLERLMRDGAVLPMRFGLVSPDDAQVRDVLEQQRDAYAERLGDLDGCVEYHLKASREEADLLREIVGGSEEIRRLNDLTREEPAAHDERVALGELVAHEVSAREQSDAADLVARLASQAAGHVLGQPGEGCFLRTSFLVRRDEADSFARAVEEEAQHRGEAYTLNLHGPLPPYSFV